MLKSDKRCAPKKDSEKQQGSGNKYVTRYRRTKNLIKKCAEISSQCELDMVLLIFDRKNNRLREIHTSQDMTLKDVVNTVNSGVKDQTFKYKKEYIGPVILSSDANGQT